MIDHKRTELLSKKQDHCDDDDDDYNEKIIKNDYLFSFKAIFDYSQKKRI